MARSLKYFPALIGVLFVVSFLEPSIVFGNTQDIQATETKSKNLIFQKFLRQVKKKFEEADEYLEQAEPIESVQNTLPEGELLFLTGRLPDNLRIQGIIFGQIRNGELVLSLKDFFNILQFPITLDLESQTAIGWYIREDKAFNLNVAQRKVVTDKGGFDVSENVFVEEDDIFVPANELAGWIDFSLDTRIASQELFIKPSQPLPMQERLERQKKDLISNKIPLPKLPIQPSPKKTADFPIIDVLNNFDYRRNGDTGEATTTINGTVATRGDFAGGTLSTRTQYDDVEGIRSVRTNYMRQSEKSDLLGALKAQRYEIGDVNAINLPLVNTPGQDIGVRITNNNPLFSLTNPTSVLSGVAFPGWDVELYRDNQFIAVQTVDKEGFFNFTNVDLFNQDNNFQLIFYGPQGEIRKENVSIPVDTARVGDSKGIYDVAITLQDEQTYLQDQSPDDEDAGALNITALYEKTLGAGNAASVGFRSNQIEGERNYVLHTGFSTLLDQTLVNLNAAFDNELETSAELVARHNFGDHNIIATSRWVGDGYDALDSDDEDVLGLFSQTIVANGPLPFTKNSNTRYASNFSMVRSTDGEKSFTGNVGVNGQWKGLRINEQINYLSADNLQDDIVSSLTTLFGNYNKNIVRTVIGYDIKPERRLNKLLANITRRVSNDLNLRTEVSKTFNPNLIEASFNIDWQSGPMRISPRVEYNTDNDVFAGLNIRFSAYKDPILGRYKTVDQNMSNTGALSAFVFLDEDGDYQYDEGQEIPLADVAVRAIQNGGLAQTNEEGVALFQNMRQLQRTDVVIEEATLKDPQWIPATEGISIIPRIGHVAKTTFPIHIAGEIDGTVYGADSENILKPLKNIRLNLFNTQGKLSDTTISDFGGFYYFSKIPPGNYYIMIDSESAERYSFLRPKPKPIQIGYDGTLLFGKDIQVVLNKADIPSIIISDLNDYKQRHPALHEAVLDHDISLNLGQYNSRLLMGLIWSKINRHMPNFTQKVAIYAKPTQSNADPASGKHTLRVGLKSGDLDVARNLCEKLMKASYYCQVEIRPSMFEKNKISMLDSTTKSQPL